MPLRHERFPCAAFRSARGNDMQKEDEGEEEEEEEEEKAPFALAFSAAVRTRYWRVLWNSKELRSRDRGRSNAAASAEAASVALCAAASRACLSGRRRPHLFFRRGLGLRDHGGFRGCDGRLVRGFRRLDRRLALQQRSAVCADYAPISQENCGEEEEVISTSWKHLCRCGRLTNAPPAPGCV